MSAMIAASLFEVRLTFIVLVDPVLGNGEWS